MDYINVIARESLETPPPAAQQEAVVSINAQAGSAKRRPIGSPPTAPGSASRRHTERKPKREYGDGGADNTARSIAFGGLVCVCK
jgi:hypothetical protein